MPGDPLPLADRRQVHLIDHGPVVLDDSVGDVHAEVTLGLHHGDPELAFHDHLGLRCPEADHGPAGVAGGEDVLHGVRDAAA